MDQDNQSQNMNSGPTSAIQNLCLLVALGMSMCIAHIITLQTQTVYITESIVQLLLTLYMSMAITFMFILWRSASVSQPAAHDNNSTPDVEPTSLDTTHEEKEMLTTRLFQMKLRKFLPLIGVTIFFTLGSFQDILQITAHVSCLGTYIGCGSKRVLKSVASVMFNTCRLVFMGTEMIFCYAFYNKRKFSGNLACYGLVVIVATTVMIWFHTTLYDSDGVFNGDNTIRTREDCQVLREKMTLEEWHCLIEKSELFNSTVAWGTLFYPLNIEFLLLVIEMVLHLFILTITASSSSQKSTNSTVSGASANSLSSNEIVDLPSEPTNTVSDDVANSTTQTGCDTDTPTLPQTPDSDRNPSPSMLDVPPEMIVGVDIGDTDDLAPEMNSADTEPLLGPRREAIRPDPKPEIKTHYYGPLLFLWGVIFNVLMVSLAIFTFQYEHQQTWVSIYAVTTTCFWLFAIVACLVGLRVSRSFESDKTHRYKGHEAMVIFSAFGIFLYRFFTLESVFPCFMGTSHRNNDTHLALNSTVLQEGHSGSCFIGDTWILLFEALFNLVEIYLQTNFLSRCFHLRPGLIGTIKCNRESQEESDNGSQADSSPIFDTQRRLFKNVVIYLLMSNFTSWVIYSFVKMKNPKIEPIQEYYFSRHNWEYIIHLTMPLGLFYSFNSFILFTEIYLDH